MAKGHPKGSKRKKTKGKVCHCKKKNKMKGKGYAKVGRVLKKYTKRSIRELPSAALYATKIALPIILRELVKRGVQSR